jgi:Nucleotidyltransferase of unknown function (DUF6036)
MRDEFHAPWKRFLEELDALLSEPIVLHCIGGFAVVAAYHLPRSTNDLDYFTLIPPYCGANLEELSGEGSKLAGKHKVHVHRAAVASLPLNYEDRLVEIFPGHFRHLRLFVLDPYDLVLSKLSRNIERDRDDVKHLAKTQKLDPTVLRERYKELRVNLIGPPEKHDATLEFWLEAYFHNQ